jgi:hypothetical protein
MKTKILFLSLFACLFFRGNMCFAQVKDSVQYLDVEYDFLTTKKSFTEFYFKAAFFGINGIGVKSSYLFHKKFYISLSAEIGTCIQMKWEPRYNSLLRYNFDFRTGYVLYSIIKNKERSYDLFSDNDYYYYYEFDVPVHRELTLEAGYSMVPASDNLISADAIDTATIHFNAPAINIGLKWKSYSCSKLKSESRTFIHNKSKFRSFGEIYLGLVIPVLNQIDSPDPHYNPMLSDKIGYCVFLRVPFSTRKGTSVYLGYQSVGYGHKHQFTFLYSFNLGFLNKRYTAIQKHDSNSQLDGF